MAKQSFQQKRRYTRFKPDPGTIAFIDPAPEQHSRFRPQIPALVFSESYGGCGLVILGWDELEKGDICQIKVGRLAPIESEVVWRKNLDSQVATIGIKFLE
jgi:hypothetical protein